MWKAEATFRVEARDGDRAHAIITDILDRMRVPVVRQSPAAREEAVPGSLWTGAAELDLSAAGPVEPDDAPTRLRFLARNLPGVPWVLRSRPDGSSYEWSAPATPGRGKAEEIIHPAIRTAEIVVSAYERC
jgi:hypothetical protein